MHHSVRRVRGIRSHIIGLNLWVISSFLILLLFSMEGGFIQFPLALIILCMIVAGFVYHFIGQVRLIIAAARSKGIWAPVISSATLVIGPLVIGMGITTPAPMGVFLIHLGLFMALSSMAVSHLGLGGRFVAIPAILAVAVLLGYTYSIISYSESSASLILIIGLFGAFIFLVEITYMVSYWRAKMDLEEETSGTERRGGGLSPDEAAPLDDKVDGTLTAGPIRLSDMTTGPEEQGAISGTNPPIEPEGIGGFGFRILEAERDGSPIFTDPGPGPAEDASFQAPPLFSDVPEDVRPVAEDRIPDDPYYEQNTSRPEPPFIEAEPDPEPEKVTVEDAEEINIELDEVIMDGQDLYQILKVDRNASSERIRKAYRHRAMLFHPDHNREMGPLYAQTIEEEMRKINLAKEWLLDPVKRAIYDGMIGGPDR